MKSGQQSRSDAHNPRRGWNLRCSLALLILAGSLSLFARPLTRIIVPLPKSDHKDGQQKQIEGLEEQWRTAVLASDSSAMSALLAEDYVGIGPDGTILNKGEELHARTSGLQHLEELNIVDRKIRIYGTTAVVTSKVRVRGTYFGQPLLGEYRYTRVWSITRGPWRIVSFEANRVHDTSARSH